MNASVPAQMPSVYRRRVGDDIIVTAASDGYLDADVSVLQRISREDIDRMLHEHFRPSLKFF
jgi:hypothetical protein